jgi:hypothetical protein
MRHDRLAFPAKQSEDVVNQPPLRRCSRNRRRKQVEVTNLSHSAHNLFGFHPVHSGLNGCVRWTLLRRKSLLYFANGALLFLPQGLHDLELEL